MQNETWDEWEARLDENRKRNGDPVVDNACRAINKFVAFLTPDDGDRHRSAYYD